MIKARIRAAKRPLVFILLGFLLCLLVFSPMRYASACLEGITLWAGAVLPALFPFFILTSVLTKLGAADNLSQKLSPVAQKFKLPGCAAYCFLLSILSGYPVGARTIAELYARRELTEKSAARLSILCSTSGPMFLLGTVGGAMFNNMRAGAILLTSHLLGVILVCLALMPFAKSIPSTKKSMLQPRTGDIFGESVQGAVSSILTVGGYIALFFVLSQAADDLHITAPLIAVLTPLFGKEGAHGLTTGLLEATHGCALLAAAQSSLSLPATAFVVTFGGACILAQQLSFLKNAGVKSSFFLGIKALQGVTAFAVCIALCAIFPV